MFSGMVKKRRKQKGIKFKKEKGKRSTPARGFSFTELNAGWASLVILLQALRAILVAHLEISSAANCQPREQKRLLAGLGCIYVHTIVATSTIVCIFGLLVSVRVPLAPLAPLGKDLLSYHPLVAECGQHATVSVGTVLGLD